MGKTDYLQGALDLLILNTLALGPNHGWGIQQRIRQVSRDALTVSQGSLYPALHRLEAAGIVSSEMTLSDNNRKARVYRLTATGRRRLTRTWVDYRRRKPTITLKTLSIHLRTNLLATGRFITALPRSVLRLYAEPLSLKILPVDLPTRSWPVAIVTLKHRTLSPVVARFIDCTREFASNPSR